MIDRIKDLIWELVEPQLEMYDKTNLPMERTLLEHKVLDIFQEIESEEDDRVANAVTSAWADGWDMGHQAASEEIDNIRKIMRSSVKNLKEVIDALDDEGYGY